jgi:hypothetical protein
MSEQDRGRGLVYINRTPYLFPSSLYFLHCGIPKIYRQALNLFVFPKIDRFHHYGAVRLSKKCSQPSDSVLVCKNSTRRV